MKEFLETTFGKVLLGGVVTIVWGINFINFSELSSGNDGVAIQEQVEVQLSDLVVPEKAVYQYKSNGRDPFSNSTKPAEEVSVVEENKTKEPELPALKLTGIFDGMAAISDEAGKTYILGKGEQLNPNIRIEEIASDSVIIEFNNKKFTLKLE